MRAHRVGATKGRGVAQPFCLVMLWGWWLRLGAVCMVCIRTRWALKSWVTQGLASASDLEEVAQVFLKIQYG